MARWAASRSSLGGAKLGIPWARLTPPYWLLTRVISRITDSVNPWTRLEIMEGGVGLLLLEADHHPGDLFLVDPDRDLLRPARQPAASTTASPVARATRKWSVGTALWDDDVPLDRIHLDAFALEPGDAAL